MIIKQTKEQFIKKAILKHGNRYDYSMVEYKGSQVKIKVICSIHGIFEQAPYSHLNGANCPNCAHEKQSKSQTLTTTDFINKARTIHGDLYDYSLIDYKNAKTKVKILCRKHGEFSQMPDCHIGQKQTGCPKCYGKNKTNEEILNQFKKIHGDKYDYSLFNYVTGRGKIKIICRKHGIFEQRTAHHLKGHGCKKCGIEPFSISKSLSSANKFVEKANKIHNNLYDYSLVKYEKCGIVIDIICSIHGCFQQTPNSHLSGSGCPKCIGKYKTTEDIIREFKEVHKDNYDYSNVIYNQANDKVIIICKKHGKFTQKPSKHLSGRGCPICKESHGERKIRIWLKNNNFNFEFQKRFDNCKDKNTLPFDFYIPELNTCIEFDGELHFKSIEVFGGIDKLLETQKKDKIKDNYCKNNNINLLRIKFDENIIEKLEENIIFHNIYK